MIDHVGYMLRIIGLLLMAIVVSHCSDNNNINSAPEISYNGINKDSLNQGSLGSEDTLVVSFSFIDINGDLSGVDGNLIITDNRTGEVHLTNEIPDLPIADNGNVGSAIILIPTLCCLFEDPNTPACSNPPGVNNSVSFSIKVIDAAGNESNSISTPDIRLLCN